MLLKHIFNQPLGCMKTAPCIKPTSWRGSRWTKVNPFGGSTVRGKYQGGPDKYLGKVNSLVRMPPPT